MDKRELAARFRDRLRLLLDTGEGGTAAFVRDTGIDRSALSQFLDPSVDRLPRAEALRRIAAARGVSTDWLLDLDNAPEGRQEISSSFKIENAEADTISPLEEWQREAEGHKLRYVPSILPDMLNLKSVPVEDRQGADARGRGVENVLDGLMPGDMDIEIAMPIQTLESLATQTGLWSEADPLLCQRQLEHMATICDDAFPALRLHLYDGTKTFSAAFTVFGKLRVAVYIGDAYLVLTGRDPIKAFVRRFDNLVRQSLVSPNRVGEALRKIATQAAG